MNKFTRRFAAIFAFAAILSIFGSALAALPDGYVQVEYVKGDTKAWIDLETKITQADTVVCKFELPPEPSLQIIYGGRTDGNAKDSCVCGSDLYNLNFDFVNTSIGNGRLQFKYVEKGIPGHLLVTTNGAAIRCAVDLTAGGTVYANNTVMTETFETPSNIRLFWASGTVWATDTQCFAGKIHSFAIIRGDVPRMDLVPCINPVGVVGFYDIIGKRFFGNSAGKGVFRAGKVSTILDRTHFLYNLEISPAEGRLTTPLEDFPLLVRLSSARQTGFNPSDCGVNGSGLRFVLEDGTLLSHEIDCWSMSGEDCCVWVNVPALTANTKIYACWHPIVDGPLPTVNPANAWPRNVAVYHFSEPTGAAVDSSGNGYDSTNAPTSLATTEAKVGLARDVDKQIFKTGVTDIVTPVGKKNLAAANQLTCSGWMLVERLPSEISATVYEVLFDKGNYMQNGWYQCVNEVPTRFAMCGGSTTVNNIVDVTMNPSMQDRWVYITAVYDMSNGNAANAFYANGTKLNLSRNIAATESDHELTFLSGLRGKADELRIRDSAVSAAWVQADYAVQNDPTFVNYVMSSSGSILIDDLPTQRQKASEAMTPVPTVRHRVTGETLDASLFDYAYDRNTSAGWATVTVTGKAGTDYAGQSASARFYILSGDFDASSYVTDGLVAHWDYYENAGVGQHTETMTTWTALKGGVNFALVGNAMWANDGLTFPGDATSCAMALSTAEGFSAAFPSGVKTVETVMTPKAVSAVMQAIVAPNFCFNFNAGTSIIPTVGGTDGKCYQKGVAGKTETYSTAYTADDVSSILWRNGVMETAAADGRTAKPPADVWLGCNGAAGENPYDGTIHSIRIYGRALTANEILWNAAVDRIRFSGADPVTEFETLGIRKNAKGEIERILSVDAGANGQVKVTANGVTTAAAKQVEVWVKSGRSVKIEYVPDLAGDWHFLSGCPEKAKFATPSVVSFAMPENKWCVTAVPFVYSDDNIVSMDASVRAMSACAGRTVYVFTNATDGLTTTFLRRPMVLDDALVVGGGGGGGVCASLTVITAGGGGGGGVLPVNIFRPMAAGDSFQTIVGKGGLHTAGGTSALIFGGETWQSFGGATRSSAGDGAGGASGGTSETAGCAGGARGATGVYVGGGGGGATKIGGDGRQPVAGKWQAGKGGDGLWNDITGVNHCYGSGGGGLTQVENRDPINEETQSPYFGEGGTESGGRGGLCGTRTLSGGGEWSGEWNVGYPGVDGLGGGSGANGFGGDAVGGRGVCGGVGTVILGFTSIGDTSRVLSVEEIANYAIPFGGAAQPHPLVRCGQTVLTEDTDYDIHYANNAEEGTASFMVIGKGAYAGLTRRVTFQTRKARFVAPDGTGDGSDWAHAMNLTNAVNGLTNGTYEIWCKAGSYDLSDGGMRVGNCTTIRGGFAGDALNAARKDPTGAKTVFDGGNNCVTLLSSQYVCPQADFETKPIVVEDCTFQRATRHCIVASEKATPFVIRNCEFLNTVLTTATYNPGLAFHIYKTGGAPLTISNCRFEGNLDASASGCWVYTIWADTVGAVTIEGCSFVTNGVLSTQSALSHDSQTGHIVWINVATSASIRDCDFRGNCLIRGGTASDCIRIIDVSATIERCRFVGNTIRVTTANAVPDGLVCLKGGRSALPVVLRSCTFAYNSLDCLLAAPSSCVHTDGVPPLTVENCIFGKNVASDSNMAARDFSGSNATITYSSFESLEKGTKGACLNVDAGTGCIAADPKFKTNDADLTNPDEVVAIDVHLRSWSPCVNAGNPDSDWSQEPKPNGKRINMGGYGGTSEAAKTPPGLRFVVH